MELGLVVFVVDLGVNDSGSREREREGERDDLASWVEGLGFRFLGVRLLDESSPSCGSSST